jgi:hypothetical protein
MRSRVFLFVDSGATVQLGDTVHCLWDATTAHLREQNSSMDGVVSIHVLLQYAQLLATYVA